MDIRNRSVPEACELRPVIGLTRGLQTEELEKLTINAIQLHRDLLEAADCLYVALPDDYKTGKASGGEQHRAYIEAMIEMHAQMAALNTLVEILGYLPTVVSNEKRV